jgi:hypothetical protein
MKSIPPSRDAWSAMLRGLRGRNPAQADHDELALSHVVEPRISEPHK